MQLTEVPPLALAATALAGAALFAVLARRVAGGAGLPLDDRARAWVLRAPRPLLARAAWLLYFPGRPYLYMPAALLISYALRRRGVDAAWAPAAAALLGWLSHRITKRFLARERPPSQVDHPERTTSYPSGHTAPTTAIALTTAYVLATRGLAAPAPAATIALALAAAVGLARVARDQHWLTDVVGGWAIGTAITAALALTADVYR